MNQNMITQLELKNFAIFKELSIVFSPRINVIIGENSFGKTQLLKAAYIVSVVGSLLGVNQKTSKAQVEDILTDKLINTFRPSANKLGGLYHRGGEGNAHINAKFASDNQLGVFFAPRSRKAWVNGNYKTPITGGSVFIPTKEILSFLGGIFNPEADQATLTSLFDETYLELMKKLLQKQNDKVEEKTVWCSKTIADELHGKFVFNDATVGFIEGEYKEYKNIHASKYYFSRFQNGISATMTAEGYRKIGVLQRLLENQVVGTGVSGPLFWDEPESNMNPKLMRMLVGILLELSRKEQQIILATHDYVLLKWLDLLKGKEDHVRFHTLYRDVESKEIKVDSTDEYSMINKSAISDAFADLYDEEVKRALGAIA